MPPEEPPPRCAGTATGGRGCSRCCCWPRPGAAAYALTRTDSKVVPTVVNEQVSVAQTQVQNAGFTPNLIYRTDSHRAGTVIAQNPLGQTKAPAGSTVSLTVSQGRGNTSITSVVGLPQSQAIRQLRRQGLKVARIQHESSADVPSGQATRTDPAAGVSVPVGSGVTLYISSGKPQVNVKDVTGQSQAAAAADPARAGIHRLHQHTGVDHRHSGQRDQPEPVGRHAWLPQDRRSTWWWPRPPPRPPCPR